MRENQKENWITTNPANSAEDPTVGNLPNRAIGWVPIRNACVTADRRYSGVLTDHEYLLPRGLTPPESSLIVSRPPVGGLLAHRKKLAMLQVFENRHLEKAVFAGALSPHNWFHWIIDSLPAVELARFLPSDFAEAPLLIPGSALSRNHWTEMLSLVSHGRAIVPLDNRTFTRVDELAWLQGPTARGNFNSKVANGDFSLETEAMNRFRGLVIEKLELAFSPEKYGRRIFLARSDGSLRSYNQTDILEIAGRFGFEPLFLEQLSLRASVDRLLHAELIIGPHGAGWASALFSEAARKALIWTWNEAKRENWFHNILAARDVAYTTFFTGPGSNSSNYFLEPAEFERVLAPIID